MRIRTTLTIAALVLAATTACSSSTTKPATDTAAPVAASSSPAKAADAATVTAKLAKTLPVKLTVTYDGGSDPNGRLGRPHQYVSKTAFDDTRVSSNPKAAEDAVKGHRDSISYGGTVEVFATAEDAKAWADYVDKGQQAIGLPSAQDYIYRSGVVVVRVSHLLTVDQAKAYEQVVAS